MYIYVYSLLAIPYWLSPIDASLLHFWNRFRSYHRSLMASSKPFRQSTMVQW